MDKFVYVWDKAADKFVCYMLVQRLTNKPLVRCIKSDGSIHEFHDSLVMDPDNRVLTLRKDK